MHFPAYTYMYTVTLRGGDDYMGHILFLNVGGMYLPTPICDHGGGQETGKPNLKRELDATMGFLTNLF